jgi:hypothetical protein
MDKETSRWYHIWGLFAAGLTAIVSQNVDNLGAHAYPLVLGYLLGRVRPLNRVTRLMMRYCNL